MVDDPSKRHLRRNPKSAAFCIDFPGGLQKGESSRFHRVFSRIQICWRCVFGFWTFWILEIVWLGVVFLQTTSVSRSGIFPSTLFGFLSVIIVVIHECKWYVATIERPVISKSLFFFDSWKAWNVQSTGPWWPSPPTGSAEQPKLGGVLFSV